VITEAVDEDEQRRGRLGCLQGREHQDMAAQWEPDLPCFGVELGSVCDGKPAFFFHCVGDLGDDDSNNRCRRFAADVQQQIRLQRGGQAAQVVSGLIKVQLEEARRDASTSPFESSDKHMQARALGTFPCSRRMKCYMSARIAQCIVNEQTLDIWDSLGARGRRCTSCGGHLVSPSPLSLRPLPSEGIHMQHERLNAWDDVVTRL
jgi:hypothetical protein